MNLEFKSPWLLLDVSYLAYRAFFAFGNKLSFNEIPTAVVFGVLREVLTLQETFNTKRVAFCFDHGKPLRADIYPEYKAHRKTGDKLEEKLAVKEQIVALRCDYLNQIGFRNICFQEGYEADDFLAGIPLNRPSNEFILVTSDHDLYQALASNVSIWNPTKKEMVTKKSFVREFGIEPMNWVDVKAIGGCSSDNVPGVDGVAEVTAAKYMRGDLTKGKIYDSIRSNAKLIRRNKKLVKLPFPGLDPVILLKDKIMEEGWDSLIKRLGMTSLIRSLPGIGRKPVPAIEKASLGVW